MGGYVFAIASYAPLDFSASRTVITSALAAGAPLRRPIAKSPAGRTCSSTGSLSAVLWDKDTPYDFDVDYYFPTGLRQHTEHRFAVLVAVRTAPARRTSGTALVRVGLGNWLDIRSHYQSTCRDCYNSVHCFSPLAFYGVLDCTVGSFIAKGASGSARRTPDRRGVDVPNEGVVRGGLFTPTPAPVIPTAGDGPTGTLHESLRPGAHG